VGRETASRLVACIGSNPGRDAAEDALRAAEATKRASRDLAQPVRLGIAARPQVHEPLVVTADRWRCSTDDRRRVRGDEPATLRREHVRAPPVGTRHLVPSDTRTIETDVQPLIDPLARGDRDL
jgi:hypothetical protein